jgi:hypothetical protein
MTATMIDSTNETVEAPEPMTEMERLLAQKQRLYDIMKDAFGEDSERYIKLKKMYDAYGDRLIEAPASGKVHYHNAYVGGYIDHILHVHDAALDFARVLKKRGGWVDFTKAELVMAALHHDLWKLKLRIGIVRIRGLCSSTEPNFRFSRSRTVPPFFFKSLASK